MGRKLILTVLAVLVLVPFIFAAEITGSATVTTVGQYLWRGMLLYDGVSMQPALTVGLNKFEISYWGSFDGMVEGEYKMEESDLTVSFEDSLPFAEMVLLNAGFITYIYHYPDPGQGTSVEVFAGLSLDTLLEPYLTFYYDTMLGDGGYLELGISHSMELGPLEAGGSLTAGYNFGQYGYDPCFSAVTLNISATYDIAGSGIKITPAFIGQLALNDQLEYESTATWSVAVNYDFTIGGGEEKKEGATEE